MAGIGRLVRAWVNADSVVHVRATATLGDRKA